MLDVYNDNYITNQKKEQAKRKKEVEYGTKKTSSAAICG